MGHEPITVRRGVEAVEIPHGSRVTIPAGTEVWITQALGDSYTVQVPNLGGLYRVAGSDADALGHTAPAPGRPVAAAAGPLTEDAIWAALREVYDPEIPVNVVDLGLIYDLRVEPAAGGQSRVAVKMTLTAQGCGMGPVLAMDAQQRIAALPGVAEADVQVVWDPPWTPHMISPEGRAKLGMD